MDEAAVEDKGAAETMLQVLQAELSRLVAVVREAKANGEKPVDVLQEQNLVPDAVQYTLALRALRLEEQFNEALELYAAMDRVFEADVSVYTELIGVHIAMGYFSRAVDTYRKMRRLGIKPNLSCFNCMLRVHAQSCDVEESLDLLEEMDREDILPDVTSFELALKTCSYDGSRAIGRNTMTTVEDFFNRMQALGIVPSATCYRRAFRTCRWHGNWERGVDLLSDMLSKGVVANDLTLRHFLTMCCNTVDIPGEVAKIFKRLEDNKSVTLLEVHYDTVITQCAKEGDWAEVIDIASRMPARQCEPSIVTINSVLTACVEMGRWEAALSLLNTIRSHEDTDPPALMAALSEAIRACVKAEEWQEVFKLATELRRFRRKIDWRSPDLIDVKGMPGEVAGALLRATLNEAIQRAYGVEEAEQEEEEATEKEIVDVVVAVNSEDLLSTPGTRSRAIEGTAAGAAITVALEILGVEANPQCLTQPFPCIRIPASSFQGPLMEQRVKSAIGAMAVGAEEGASDVGEADDASPRSI